MLSAVAFTIGYMGTSYATADLSGSCATLLHKCCTPPSRQTNATDILEEEQSRRQFSPIQRAPAYVVLLYYPISGPVYSGGLRQETFFCYCY